MSKSKNWEPEFKYESVTGTFVDYVGNERSFTMVAVSIPADKMCTLEVYSQAKYHNIIHYDKVADIAKMLTIGVSVRSASDKENGMGEQIAYGKALKSIAHSMYVTTPGMINTVAVKALLEKEAEYFKANPGSYIKMYDEHKKRYEEKGVIANAEKR